MPPKKKRTNSSKDDVSETKSKYFKTEDEEEASGKLKPTTSKSVQKGASAVNQRLPYSFYDQECTDLAKNLLGKKVVRQKGGQILSGIIVETEAYLGGEDKAAHSYNGKRTPKNEAMYMPPATAYVYHIYGSYTCLNISAKGDGAAVLLRAIDPVDGIDVMKKARSANRKSGQKKEMKLKDVGNGPSKLTQALAVDKESINKQDLTTFESLWLENGNEVKEEEIIACPRIGIDYAKEWVTKPLRFYIKGNESVSVKNKEAESQA